MQLHVRKYVTIVEEVHTEMGRGDAGGPLKKVAVCAVIRNPYAGEYVEDLSALVNASEAIGEELARRAREAVGGQPFESYGKGGLVGSSGDQEHVNAMLTTVFGEVMRKACGGGLAWIPSMTKRSAPGERLDVPLAFKDALYVRSHYDGITVSVPDAPGADEIVLVAAFATRGRLNARLGGVDKNRIQGDGLR